MTSLATILKIILSGQSEYCCFCLSITENERFYNIEDEFTLDTGQTKAFYEILSSVFGYEILKSISTHNVCQHCTQLSLNCYKFINDCTHNVQKLENSIQSLGSYTAVNKDYSDNFKSLFIVLDKKKYTVNDYFDVQNNYSDNTNVLERLNAISEKCTELKIEFEEYQENDIDRHIYKSVRQRNQLQDINLADIVIDKTDLNNLKCKSCFKLYSTEIKLKQHYLRVHAPKNFKCPECHRSFGTSILLRRHTKDSHCSVVCSQCGKIYTNTYSLRHHERSHTLRLICETCGKTYKDKHSFNNHIKMKLCCKLRKTNAEAKFMCNYCEKKYTHKTALSVHIRLEHENGRALTCNWCKKKLSSTSKLKEHIIKHTKEKNFECEVCKAKFVSKPSLLYHTRIHTGEKPYKCDHCGMTFISASRRSEHVKRYHEPLVLECDICHGIFKSNMCLMRHRKRHFNVASRLYHKPAVLTDTINIFEVL